MKNKDYSKSKKYLLIFFVHKGIDKTNKKNQKCLFGSGITLTKDEIESFIKVIRSLENRRTLLKEATKKSNDQEGKFLGNFLVSLMEVGLPLMEDVLSPLAKNVFMPYD